MRNLFYLLTGIALLFASCSSHSEKPGKKKKVKTKIVRNYDAANKLVYTETTNYEPQGHASSKTFRTEDGFESRAEYYVYDPVWRMTEIQTHYDSTAFKRIFFFYNDTVRTKWITYFSLASEGKDPAAFFTVSREELAKLADTDTTFIFHKGGMLVDYQLEKGVFMGEKFTIKTSFEYNGNEAVSKSVTTKVKVGGDETLLKTIAYTYDEKNKTIQEKTTNEADPENFEVKISHFSPDLQLLNVEYFSGTQKTGYSKVEYEYYL